MEPAKKRARPNDDDEDERDARMAKAVETINHMGVFVLRHIMKDVLQRTPELASFVQDEAEEWRHIDRAFNTLTNLTAHRNEITSLANALRTCHPSETSANLRRYRDRQAEIVSQVTLAVLELGVREGYEFNLCAAGLGFALEEARTFDVSRAEEANRDDNGQVVYPRGELLRFSEHQRVSFVLKDGMEEGRLDDEEGDSPDTLSFTELVLWVWRELLISAALPEAEMNAEQIAALAEIRHDTRSILDCNVHKRYHVYLLADENEAQLSPGRKQLYAVEMTDARGEAWGRVKDILEEEVAEEEAASRDNSPTGVASESAAAQFSQGVAAAPDTVASAPKATAAELDEAAGRTEMQM